MKYRYRATESFWESFYDLSSPQKHAVRRLWKVFKENPFDPRLRTHKIHSLSAAYNQTVYAVAVEADLRVVFMIIGDVVWSLDVGNHDIYKV